MITYRTGGSPEAIDEKTGFVVGQGDIEGAIQAIKQVKLVVKHVYTKACRERAVKNFNKKDRYSEYLQLYNEILKRK